MYQSGLLITALGGPACQCTISRHRQRIGDIVRRYSKLARILPHLREPSNDRSVVQSLGEEATDFAESKSELMSVRFYLYYLFSEGSKKWLAQ
jgi:hypothetical protein